jgi:murein DD-endopeptidase MepM/ murein hydrolase activator NlpD
MEPIPFLYYPVKDEIDQANLFGTTSPMYAALGQKGHPGIDFECKSGTPVYAPCDGDALYVTDEYGGCGIWIRTPNHTAPQFNIILWHMYPANTPGFPYAIPTEQGIYTPVKAGQMLGYSDNSGFPTESTGPHLHLGVMPCEVRESDGAITALSPENGYLGCVDPTPYFNDHYAQDIQAVEAVIASASTVVSNIAATTDATPAQKLDWLAELAVLIEKLW